MQRQPPVPHVKQTGSIRIVPPTRLRSLRTRTTAFCRRHRALVTLATIVAVVLVIVAVNALVDQSAPVTVSLGGGDTTTADATGSPVGQPVQPVIPTTAAPVPVPPPPPVVTTEVPAVTTTVGVFDAGTCLTGTIPDSTVAVPADDVTPVPCGSPLAHYRVIQTFPDTANMALCDSVRKTQYAYSSEITEDGVPVNQYVYCLVGLGRYAR